MQKRFYKLSYVFRSLVIPILLFIFVFVCQSSSQGTDGAAKAPDQPLRDRFAGGGIKLSPVLSGSPLYDSGWIDIARDESKILTHDLDGNLDYYMIYMECYSSSCGINHVFYGGADLGQKTDGGTANNKRQGAYWSNLNSSTITVYRRPEDDYAEKIRIRIWVDFNSDCDTKWISLDPGSAALTLNHNVGGNPDYYLVYMESQSSNSGVNQRYYGGNDFGTLGFAGTRNNERVGAYWRELNSVSIKVFRREEDDYASKVRIRFWIRPTPTYDSGWVAVNKGEMKFLSHQIGGNTDDYTVDLQYRSSSSGVNHCYYGGADFGTNPPAGRSAEDRVGAYWRNLDTTGIKVVRREEDVYAEEVRVRIWNLWNPSAPDYDSRWSNLAPGADPALLNHNLGGDVTKYLVDMQFRSDNDLIHNRYYGGADMGDTFVPGTVENDRVGAYWFNLTGENISLFRRQEDEFTSQARVRIWIMPKPDYESLWIPLDRGAPATQLIHNLGGDPSNYLVDMAQYTASFGINHIMYGGVDLGVKAPSEMNENDRVGSYWMNLTDTSLSVYRCNEDIYASFVHIRIWRMSDADYDSGWVSLGTSGDTMLFHNLLGNRERYLVNMLQLDNGEQGVNQRYYGGMYMGTNAPPGFLVDSRVGSYWHNLTNVLLFAFRQAEDQYADNIRVRIWRTPPSVSFNEILDHILGKAVLEPELKEEADMNGDSLVNAADLIFMLQLD